MWSSNDHAELLKNAVFFGLIFTLGIFIFTLLKILYRIILLKKDLVLPALTFLLNNFSYRALMVNLV